MKRTLALILAVCLCLSCMVMVCSAADVGTSEPTAVDYWIAVTKIDGVRFRSSPDDTTDDNVIALFSKGDSMRVSNSISVNAKWYYGKPAPGSAPYALFHGVDGYSAALFFNVQYNR